MKSTSSTPLRVLAAALGSLALALTLVPAASGTTGTTPAPAAPAAAPAPKTGHFTLATYNILGSNHTAGRSRWRSGVSRTRFLTSYVRNKGFDVVGMQEVQKDQLRVLQTRLAGRYRVWPGRSLGNQGVRLQIAWRKAKFDLVSTGRVTTSFDRQRRPVPYVLLREKASKRVIVVMNTHNSPLRLEGERDRATDRLIRLIKRMRASGRTVFFVGDMNEKSEVFCKVVGRTDLNSASGGRVGQGGCRTPARRLIIDWIFGGGPKMSMSGYNQRKLGGISDHHLVHTSVTLRPN